MRASSGFNPGEAYEYLNMNYALLTVVLEDLTDHGLGDIMKSRIFQPLGMSQTVFLGGPQQPIADRATGYQAEVTGGSGVWTTHLVSETGTSFRASGICRFGRAICSAGRAW